MKLYSFLILSLSVGGLCKINDVCTVQTEGRSSNELLGKLQPKKQCLESGLASFSIFTKRADVMTDEDDSSLECCIEITCEGSRDNKCRNNVNGNACATGSYVPNFRDRVLCPHTSDNDNIQCCVGRVRQGLKARSPLDDDIGSILEDTFMGDDNDFSIGTLSRLSGSSLSTSAPPLTMKSTFETNSANDIKTGVTSSLPNYDNTYAAGSNLQKTTAQQASSLSHPLTVGMNDVDWSMNRINSMSAYHPSNNPSAPLGVTANLGGGSTIGASLQNSQPTISYQNNGFKADISAGTYNPLRPLTWSGPTNNISGRIGLNIPKVKRWLGTISSKFNVGK